MLAMVTSRKEYVFFQLSQMQKAILDGMADKLAALAQVTYIKTTESSDRDKFSRYGIRGLPSLIIEDKNGNEAKRFPPGIQSEEKILAALQKINLTND